MIDPAYKVVALMWAKDLAETVVMIGVAYPILRRVVKKYLLDLKCPQCGKKYGDAQEPVARQWIGCQATVPPYWNTLLECTSETCHRPLPCPVHGSDPGSLPREKQTSTPGGGNDAKSHGV